MDKIMKPRMTNILLLALFLSIIVGILSAANAATSDNSIEMLNKSGNEKFVFGQEITKISVGDTVTFLPTTKGHNAVTIKGMLPEGATKIKTPYNKEAVVTFTVPGIYGVKCAPHVAAGMVALIVVGDVPEGKFDVSKIKLPKKAKNKMISLVKELYQ